MSSLLPKIPASAYPKRWDMVYDLMEREALDLLLVYADDHWTYGPAYARWLSGFIVHFEPVCILFSLKTEPIMLVGPESPGYAQMNSHIKDIRVLQEFSHPDEDYPFTKLEGLFDIVSDFTDPASCKKMGIAGRSMIAYDLFDSFQKILPGEWVTVDEQMGQLRAVKTPEELAVIQYAYQIAEAGIAAAIQAIEPGVPERHVAAEAEYVMRKMGAECYGIDTMVASGEYTIPIFARTTMREIAKDDLVLLTFAPRYEGYHSAIGMPILVGNPSDRAKRAVEAAIRAQRACAALLREGQGAAAEAEARSIMEEAGFGPNFLYSGIHSVGVIEFEAPIFGPSSKAIMKENMVLSIDIPVFDGDWGGLRLEDGYLIEKDGAKRLTSFEYFVQK